MRITVYREGQANSIYDEYLTLIKSPPPLHFVSGSRGKGARGNGIRGME